MAVFRYSGTDGGGRRDGYVEAGSPKEARRILEGQGIVAEDLETPSFGRTATAAWRARFYESLGMLVKSGFPMAGALRFLADDAAGAARGATLSVLDSILGGATLETAMTALSGGLPPFEKAALEIADRTGAQGEMLVRLSAFMESDRRVREKVRSALAYPAAVFCFALLLLGVVAFAILPRAAALFPGEEIPRSVKTLRIAAPVVLGAILAVAALAARFAARLSRRSRRGGADALRDERLLLALPVARRLVPQLWASRYAGTMALLLDAGLAPQAALAPAGSATGSALVAVASETAAEKVRGGASLAEAISLIAPLAPHLSAWIAVGEKTGALAELLRRASDRAADEYEKGLRRALSLLEPALVAAVGVLVLAVALSVLGPMLDLTIGG